MGSGSSRNDPCWCGSGRKQKRCHPREKPRTTSLTFKFEQPVTVDGISFNRETGVPELWREGQKLRPSSAVLQTSYERQKGPKVTLRVPFAADEPPTVMLPVALARFGRLYAIDCNTRTIATGRISLAMVTGGWVSTPNSGMSL